ncbi:MAG: Bax inhibitor-1/YccA family protein, partial [Bacilli bacterium]
PLVVGELVLFFAATFLRRRKAVGWTFVLGFTLISGMTLTPILVAYTQVIGVRLVQEAFLITAGTFGLTAFVASRKSVDFSWMRQFLFAGIIVLVGMGLLSLFVPFSTGISFVYTYLGIALFVGFMLFDVNRLTHHGVTAEQVPGVVLSLYLDFVNLFLFILQLFGLNVRAGRR